MMNKTHTNVLIIDDHPIIIEAFENTLNYIEEQSETHSFKIDSAQDCEMAYSKIQHYAVTQNLDLVILDISIPADQKLKLQSGEDLGILIRRLLPKTKILVCTSFADVFKLNQILNAFLPLGFVNKQDMTFLDYVTAIEKVLAGKKYYSQTIFNIIMQKSTSNLQLDDYDLLLLREIANGSKMRDLIGLIHLSKSTMDKRIRIMKQKFNIESNSDRDLIMAAKKEGFI
jgi:DNA-binding NarL/FixJ family response regulator